MSAPNGRASGDPVSTVAPLVMSDRPARVQAPAERIKETVAALEVPFEPSQIEWRVMNTTKGQRPARGQVVPYADQRAYTDRLNALFTPAGWTRKYTIHTSANFERSENQKISAKVVTCELTIFGVGSHSATGEEVFTVRTSVASTTQGILRRGPRRCEPPSRQLFSVSQS